MLVPMTRIVALVFALLALAACRPQATSHPVAPTSALVVASGHGWSGSQEFGPVHAPGACHINGQLPDPVCTPGAIDSAVTQANIHKTICVSGYTATVRPPVSVTSRYKSLTRTWYGLPSGTLGEYDHLIPLELGGASDTRNLWVEPGSIPNPKDKIENRLHAEVCAGTITLVAAQLAISKNWTRG